MDKLVFESIVDVEINLTRQDAVLLSDLLEAVRLTQRLAPDQQEAIGHFQIQTEYAVAEASL